MSQTQDRDDVNKDLTDEIGDAVSTATEPTPIPVNVFRTDDAIVVVAACPGAHPDDITASVEDGTLTIEVRLRSAAPKDYLVKEWEYGAGIRRLHLPDDAGLPAEASFGNGQLAISLQKGSGKSGTIDITAS